LAIAYGQKGELVKAKAERDKTLARKPEVTVEWYRALIAQVTDSPKGREQVETYFLAGMRKAGFSEK
jgi:hypothetical protein